MGMLPPSSPRRNLCRKRSERTGTTNDYPIRSVDNKQLTTRTNTYSSKTGTYPPTTTTTTNAENNGQQRRRTTTSASAAVTRKFDEHEKKKKDEPYYR